MGLGNVPPASARNDTSTPVAKRWRSSSKASVPASALAQRRPGFGIEPGVTPYARRSPSVQSATSRTSGDGDEADRLGEREGRARPDVRRDLDATGLLEVVAALVEVAER